MDTGKIELATEDGDSKLSERSMIRPTLLRAIQVTQGLYEGSLCGYPSSLYLTFQPGTQTVDECACWRFVYFARGCYKGYAF